MGLRAKSLLVFALSATVLSTTWLGGCGSGGQWLRDQTAAQDLPVRIELTDTPFYPQEDFQCGPAALATVLQASGVDVSPADLVPQVYIPLRRGSLQVELLAAARQRGRLVYVAPPELGALLGELQAGRPVLVLQQLSAGLARTWHYAVLIGYDASSGRLVLRSGRERRRYVTVSRFRKSWEPGGNWALVLLRPGELPADPQAANYIEAAAALAIVDQGPATVAAFEAAAKQWPRRPAAIFGLANAQYVAGDFAAAIQSYRAGLELEPADPAMLNNLALVYLASGDCASANAAIDRALDVVPAPSGLRSELEDSRDEIVAGCSAGN